jgi:hypothetical protein
MLFPRVVYPEGAAVVVVAAAVPAAAAAAILFMVVSARVLNFTMKYVKTTATPMVWKMELKNIIVPERG